MTTPDLTPLSLQRLSDFDSLRRLARAIVGEDHADDVVQDAWAAALSHKGIAPDSWPRWMTSVTQRIAWKRRVQTRNRRDRELAVHSATVAPAPEDLIAEIEEKQVLERALLDLDEPYRSALLMRYYGDLPVAEVARQAGSNESTTRTHVQRGLKQLRERLEAERGENWSAALLPFLLPKPSAASGVAAATLAGLSLLTVMKIATLTLAGLLLAAFGITRLVKTDGALPSTVVTGVSAPAMEPDALQPGADRVDVPEVAEARTAEPTVKAPAVAQPSAEAGEGPVTTVRLVEEVSGLPMGGVRVTVKYTESKRKFFIRRTEGRERVVTADSGGLVQLPFELNAEGQTDGNRVLMEVDLGPHENQEVYLMSRGVAADGVHEFAMEGAHSAWVVLPEVLLPSEYNAISATWTLRKETLGDEVQWGQVAPVNTNGQSLLFVIPNGYSNDVTLADTSGVLRLATTPLGRTFHAALPMGVNLGSPPIQAVRANDVTHSFKVTDASSGAPLPAANVRVKRPAADGAYSTNLSHGRTDPDGRTTLTGIPAEGVQVRVQEEGYERLLELHSLTPGGETELRLTKKIGLRTLKVVVSATHGDPIFSMHLVAEDAQSRERAVTKLVTGIQRKGKGWRFEETLENVPGGPVLLLLQSSSRKYDLPPFIRVAPGQDEVKVSLGKELDVMPVILRLPEGLGADVTYEFADGVNTGTNGPMINDKFVVSMPTDGRQWICRVIVDGYVPVLSTEADLRPSTFDGKPCLDLVPEMRKGWGTIVSAEERWVEADGPYRFHVPQMIPGAEVVDPRTTTVLGVTGPRGFVVIEAPEPLMELTVRQGDRSRTFNFKGGSAVGFGL